MTKERTAIVREPRGAIYRQLLSYGATQCETILLVVRPDLGLSPKGKQLLGALKDYLVREELAKAWPGTELLEDVARVFRYRLDSASKEIIWSAAQSLYEWQQPALPEDLCLLRSDGAPWLVTIAQEKDSYLEVTDSEVHLLLQELPELEGYIRTPLRLDS